MYSVCKARGGAYFTQTDWTWKQRNRTVTTGDHRPPQVSGAWTAHLRPPPALRVHTLTLCLTILWSFGRTVCVCLHAQAQACLGTNASNQSPSLRSSYKNYQGKIRTRNQAILYSSKASATSVYTKYMIRCSSSFHWDYYSTHLRKTYWREWGLKEF